MKNINAREALQIVFSGWCLVTLLLVGQAYGGDYYTYRDLSGILVISNNKPSPGSEIIKKETLPEVTDQEIVESRARENMTESDNKLSSLEKSVGELSENVRAQSEATTGSSQQGEGDSNIAVGVTQSSTIISKVPPDKIKRPTNLRNNLHSR
jgi:hypothetical protein